MAVSLLQTDRHAEGISLLQTVDGFVRLTSLRSVTIRMGLFATPRGTLQLNSLTNLERLSLVHLILFSPGYLDFLEHLPKLKSLIIFHCVNVGYGPPCFLSQPLS